MPTFNIQKALAAGKSEDEILGYLSTKNPKFNVEKALGFGKTKQDVISYLSTVEAPGVAKPEPPAQVGPSSGPGSGQFGAEPTVEQPAQNIPVPEWGRENPNLFGLYGAGKAVLEKAVTPAVEAASTIGGSMVSPIAGTALAYGASKQTMDLVEDYYAQLGGEAPKERTIVGELKSVAADTAMVAATGKAFEVAGPAIEKTSKVLFDTLPKRMVASALKMPLSKKWVKTLPGKEISKRMAASEEVLKSDIPHSELGLQQAKTLAKEVHGFIDDVTGILSKDPGNKINFDKAIAHGLKSAYKKASTSSNIPEAKALVDSVKTGLKKMRGKELTPTEANALKRNLWSEVQWFKEGVDPLVAKSKKGVAHQLMKQIESKYPQITPANETLAARMGVIESLEMSLAKASNKDLIPLGAKVLAAGTHPGLAATETIFSFPSVKTNVARFLAKGNPKKYSKFIYPEKPLGYTPPVKQIEKEVYSDLIKIRSGKNQQLLDAGYQETAGLSQGLSLPAKETLPLGATTISGIKDDVVKSIIPNIKTTLRPAEMKRMIKTKVAERIEREEGIRLKHLEMQFKKQSGAETGPPLKKPTMEYTKSQIPMSPEQRLKGMNKWGPGV